MDYDNFLEFSVALTGFSRLDLEGTGVGREYLEKVRQEAGDATVESLSKAWRQVARSTNPDEEMRRLILSDETLGPLARQIIKMWYLGVWQVGDNGIPVSAEAYTQGLVWDAIGAHPMAAKQQGFASWFFPPAPIRRRS